jgi:PAS domain S-box-containing protein
MSTSEINERKRAESLFRALLEAAPDAMVVVNQGGEIVLLNVQAEKQFGYRRDELVGQQVKNIIPEGFAERLIADDLRSAEDALAQQIGTGIELTGRRKDGSEFPIEIMLSPLETEEGVLISSAIRDITQRKQHEVALRELNESLRLQAVELETVNKELESFSYSVSHDLRAPLRAIDGFSQALLDESGDRLDEKGKHYLERIRAGDQRMAQLIDDLLSLSQVSSKSFERKTVDLSEIAADVFAVLARAEPNRKVAFEVAQQVTAEADEGLIRIVFQNLIENAWKFTARRDAAEIEFGVRNGNGKPQYFVHDNGTGFDMAYAGKLFGAFQRLHAADEYPGTGIGLATVARIVHRHGGKVWAEGRVNQGATFWFTL